MNQSNSTTTKVHNFSAGPAILPQEVLAKAAEAVTNFAGKNLSLLEMSHRSPEFVAVMDEAQALVKELLNLNDDYAVLFLGGGASSQFYMTAANLLPSDGTAHYLDTGTWSAKAIKEAKKYGNVNVVASSKDTNYNYVPKYTVPAEGAYLHLSSNNTIFGTQLKEFPNSAIPVVCDMSSDIFSRPVDVTKFGVIYAGAQKNMGPAGVTLVIVRKDILGKVQRDNPSMVDYRTHVEKGSMFNTPPVFPIYVSMLTMRWVKENGGVAGMEKRNAVKAATLYTEIDRNPLFKGNVAVEDRSIMNATFNVVDEAHTAPFLELCAERNLDALKGHRSVGGFRASMYNAMELDSVEALVQAMRDFETSHA
ncbi:MAG: 3-phosphoserine/phosphohydroxythreonine transaminase [Saprospiraceae bacterium]